MLKNRKLMTLALMALLVPLAAHSKESKDKKSAYQGCPSGMTFAPDMLKEISWVRSVWGFPGLGYRPPKEWNCGKKK
ncbi:MAG: hypothetical protein ACKOW3_06655 [Hyphomicrobium sp.]